MTSPKDQKNTPEEGVSPEQDASPTSAPASTAPPSHDAKKFDVAELLDSARPPFITIVDVLGWLMVGVLFWVVYLVFSEGRNVMTPPGDGTTRHRHGAAAPAIRDEPGEYTDVSALVSKGLSRAQTVGKSSEGNSWFGSLIARIKRAFGRLGSDAQSGAERVKQRPLPPSLERLGPGEEESGEEIEEPEDMSRF